MEHDLISDFDDIFELTKDELLPLEGFEEKKRRISYGRYKPLKFRLTDCLSASGYRTWVARPRFCWRHASTRSPRFARLRTNLFQT